MNIPHTPKGQLNNMLIFQLCGCLIRGTQRQFSENICSEDDLRSRIFRNICCKLSCLPASSRIFKHLKNGIIAHFQRIFTLEKSPRSVWLQSRGLIKPGARSFLLKDFHSQGLPRAS